MTIRYDATYRANTSHVPMTLTLYGMSLYEQMHKDRPGFMDVTKETIHKV